MHSGCSPATRPGASPRTSPKAALDAAIPQLDPAIGAALTNGEEERAKELERGAELFIFLKRDHGALLRITGRPRKALQYEIGNPLTATRMTRHQIPAALYAPLRVVLYENAAGGATFELRPAKVDKLVTRRFSSATGGFCAPEDIHVALYLLPGTELSFAYEVKRSRLWPWSRNIIAHKVAVFRQVNQDCPHVHHDALEFPDGELVLLTYLMEGQEATVLQLPADAVGSRAQQRAAYV